jgi:hypothetical protein
MKCAVFKLVEALSLWWDLGTLCLCGEQSRFFLSFRRRFSDQTGTMQIGMHY